MNFKKIRKMTGHQFAASHVDVTQVQTHLL